MVGFPVGPVGSCFLELRAEKDAHAVKPRGPGGPRLIRDAHRGCGWEGGGMCPSPRAGEFLVAPAPACSNTPRSTSSVEHARRVWALVEFFVAESRLRASRHRRFRKAGAAPFINEPACPALQFPTEARLLSAGGTMSRKVQGCLHEFSHVFVHFVPSIH